MKDYKLHTVEGVRDYLPSEQKQKNEIERRVNQVFERYGYKAIQTPTFEYEEIFANEDGNISRNEMYKFIDRKGNVLALRPDLTPPIARLAATSFEDDMFPLRLSYTGCAYRYIEGYQGKLHEFTQAGVELLGNNSVLSDAEVIAVAINSLIEVGLNEFVIHLGQVNFYKSIINEAKLSDDLETQIRRLVENKNIVALERLLKKEKLNNKTSKLLLQLPHLSGDIKVIEETKKLTHNKKALKALDELSEILELLDEYGVSDKVTVDLGMLSRFDYYTGIIFKAYSYGSGVEILGGGRYDRLIAQFGKDMPATGFGLNINELLTVMEKQNLYLNSSKVLALIMYKDKGRSTALKTTEKLRENGLNLVNSLFNKDLEKNIEFAKKKNIDTIFYFKDKENVDIIDVSTNKIENKSVSELLERWKRQ